MVEFHARSDALVALTPPFMPMQLDASPSVLQSGDTMSFRIWLGPLPVRWTARIEHADPAGFTDRQLAGPFAEWVHRHTFDPTGPGTITRHQLDPGPAASSPAVGSGWGW